MTNDFRHSANVDVVSPSYAQLQTRRDRLRHWCCDSIYMTKHGSSKVRGCSGLAHHPRLIQRLNNICRQRTLFQILQVRLQLLHVADTNDNTIISPLGPCLELRVMDAPSQRNLDKRQVVLLRRFLGDFEGFECRLFEVAITVQFAYTLRFGTETTFVRLDVFRLDLAGKQTAGQGVVDDDINAILATCWNELRLNSTS